MYAKRIRIKWYPTLEQDIMKWRNQGYTNEIIIYNVRN